MSDMGYAMACCLTLSKAVGIPSGRFLPLDLGMYTRLTGLGKYLLFLRSWIT